MTLLKIKYDIFSVNWKNYKSLFAPFRTFPKLKIRINYELLGHNAFTEWLVSLGFSVLQLVITHLVARNCNFIVIYNFGAQKFVCTFSHLLKIANHDTLWFIRRYCLYVMVGFIRVFNWTAPKGTYWGQKGLFYVNFIFVEQSVSTFTFYK